MPAEQQRCCWNSMIPSTCHSLRRPWRFQRFLIQNCFLVRMHSRHEECNHTCIVPHALGLQLEQSPLVLGAGTPAQLTHTTHFSHVSS